MSGRIEDLKAELPRLREEIDVLRTEYLQGGMRDEGVRIAFRRVVEREAHIVSVLANKGIFA